MALNPEKRYRCKNCGFICTYEEMDSDTLPIGDGDEAWSSSICPQCGRWEELENWESLVENENKGEVK